MERIRPGSPSHDADPLIGEKRIWFRIFVGTEVLAALAPAIMIFIFSSYVGMNVAGDLFSDPKLRSMFGLIILLSLLKLLVSAAFCALYYWIVFGQHFWPKTGCLIFKAMGLLFFILLLGSGLGADATVTEAFELLGFWAVPLLGLGLGYEAWLVAILFRDVMRTQRDAS